MDRLLNDTNSTYDNNLQTGSVAIPSHFRNVLYIFGTLTFVVNLPSIFIVIASLWRKKKIGCMNIIFLSLTDGILGIAWIIYTDVTDGNDVTFIDCYLRLFIKGMAFMASLFQVLAICIERNMVVCFNASVMKKRRNLIAIVVFSTSFVLATVIISVSSFDKYNLTFQCSIDNLFGENSRRVYAVFGVTLVVTLSCVIIAMVILFQFLLRYTIRTKTNTTRKIKPSDIRLCMTTALIVVLFMMCNLPITVINVKDGFVSDMTSSSSTYQRNLAFLFAGVNSAMNPFVYLLQIRSFRSLLMENMKYFNPCSNAVQPTN